MARHRSRIAAAALAIATVSGAWLGGASPAQADGLAIGITTDLLTLRSGAGTSNAALDYLPFGTNVEVQCQTQGELISGTYTSDWWARVDYNGQTGYVSRAYLRIPYGQPDVAECTADAPEPPPAGSEVNGPITRAEVLARAQTWVDQAIWYDMGGAAPDPQGRSYRTDCSGFVSMAFHLDQSLSTVTLPERFTQIDPNSMVPGDIVGNLGPGTAGAAGHVVIFNGWVDDSHTDFYTLEETPDYAQAKIRTWGASTFAQAAFRYNNIAD